MAADAAFQSKMQKWSQNNEGSGEVFLPLAVELFRGWHPDSLPTIRRIGSMAAVSTASEVGPTLSRLWQRLSVIVFKGVAHSMEARMAPCSLDDDFDGAPLVGLTTRPLSYKRFRPPKEMQRHKTQ